MGIGLIGPIGPIADDRSYRNEQVLLPPLPRKVEPFSETALVEESLFKLPELLVEQVIGLMDEADDRVSGDLGRSLFNIGRIGLIGPINLIGETTHLLSNWVPLTP